MIAGLSYSMDKIRNRENNVVKSVKKKDVFRGNNEIQELKARKLFLEANLVLKMKGKVD